MRHFLYRILVSRSAIFFFFFLFLLFSPSPHLIKVDFFYLISNFGHLLFEQLNSAFFVGCHFLLAISIFRPTQPIHFSPQRFSPHFCFLCTYFSCNCENLLFMSSSSSPGENYPIYHFSLMLSQHIAG